MFRYSFYLLLFELSFFEPIKVLVFVSINLIHKVVIAVRGWICSCVYYNAIAPIFTSNSISVIFVPVYIISYCKIQSSLSHLSIISSSIESKVYSGCHPRTSLAFEESPRKYFNSSGRMYFGF